MYCAPACSLPRSSTLCMLQCEAVTEPIQKCRHRNPHWQAEERRWCLHNGVVLRQLATLLQRPWEQICRFLYQLTLQRFGQILNPKCSHWNSIRVPFTRPDTCGLYDNIFDMHGNLRNPFHPYIEHILLTILDHYLDVPCMGYNGQRYPSMLDEIVHGRSEGKCTDIFRGDKDGKGARLRDEWDASGLGYNFGGSDFSPDDEEDDGDNKDGDGRDHGDDDDDDDGKNAKDISDLYSKVVQNKHKRKIVGSNSDGADNTNIRNKPKKKATKPPKKIRYGGTEKQFMGEMLPVLVHEPFDETKPWTWIRRHPKQTRVLHGTRLGRAKVHRYKRESLEVKFERARQQYSVRSLYSVGSEGSIGWEDTFGKRSYMFRRKTMHQPYDYKKLLEKPEDGMARISVASQALKVPGKNKGKPKPKPK